MEGAEEAMGSRGPRRWTRIAAAAGLLGAGAVTAQPFGPEFRINTFTPGWQFEPVTATNGAGGFVVVWNSLLQDGSGWGTFGQRFASSGAPLGPEFRVNSFTTSDQGYSGWRPAVAADPSGNFVIVWNGFLQDGAGFGVFGQRFASSGAPLGPEFRVNTYTTSDEALPSAAADSSEVAALLCVT